MFYKTLSTIDATEDQLEILREFNSKYQHRFVILHQRKLEEYKERTELQRLRKTQSFDPDQFKSIEDKRKK